MRIRCGYTVALDTFAPTPMMLLLNVRPERHLDLRSREVITYDPPVATRQFRDPFGNVAMRILVPGGRVAMSADFQIEDHGRPDEHAPEARQIPVQDLPDEALPFLLGSRFCDTDKLSQTAWSLFGSTPEGWARVQTIVDTRMAGCASTTCRPTPRAAPLTATPSRSACAATSPTSPSPCAGA